MGFKETYRLGASMLSHVFIRMSHSLRHLVFKVRHSSKLTQRLIYFLPASIHE